MLTARQVAGCGEASASAGATEAAAGCQGGQASRRAAGEGARVGQAQRGLALPVAARSQHRMPLQALNRLQQAGGA
eukprot:390587-Pyramimonas_sp.AAC.1